MINFLSSWVKNLSLALIVVSVLEMLLPNNKTKKYIKMVMGLYILFSIIVPFVNNSNIFKIDIEDVYANYSKETSSAMDKVSQNSMDDRLNQLYKEQLESDVIKKVEEKGYDVRKCKVFVHISDNNTSIESITLEIDGKNENKENLSDYSESQKSSSDSIENKIVKEIQKIQKIEIDVFESDGSEDVGSTITKTDIKIIKDFLTKEYGVSEKCLKIS